MKHKGQSVAEYMLISVVVLVAILASSFIGNVRQVYRGYFNDMVKWVSILPE